MKYKKINQNIIKEISNCLNAVDTKQTETLIEEILKAEKVFLTAVGRVNLSLQCFGKRLAHLGVNVELVGSLTEKPATKKDLLIIASGSGESIIPISIAKKAKFHKTKIGIITSANKSTLKRLCDFYVILIAPTKKIVQGKLANQSLYDKASKSSNSVQPMSSLFDQALHIYGDIVSLIIFNRKKYNKDDIWKYHANLE